MSRLATEMAYSKVCRLLARNRPCLTCEFFENCECKTIEECASKLAAEYKIQALKKSGG